MTRGLPGMSGAHAVDTRRSCARVSAARDTETDGRADATARGWKNGGAVQRLAMVRTDSTVWHCVPGFTQGYLHCAS